MENNADSKFLNMENESSRFENYRDVEREDNGANDGIEEELDLEEGYSENFDASSV